MFILCLVVFGVGLMGVGIVCYFVCYGYIVCLYDIDLQCFVEVLVVVSVILCELEVSG